MIQQVYRRYGVEMVGPSDVIVEDTLAKVLEALGGKEALDKVQTKITIGKLDANGWPRNYQAWSKIPEKLRVKLDSVVSQQDTTFDGERGWEITQGGYREIYGPELANFRINPLFKPLDSLLTCLKKGASVEFKGKEKIDKKEAYVVLFRPKDVLPETFYFNTRDYLPLKETMKIPLAGSERELIVRYGDWRKVGNVILPFSIVQETADQDFPLKSSLKVLEYELNAPIKDDFFRGPKEGYSGEPYEISLATIPRNMYKEKDAMSPTESWTFHLLVQEKYGRALKPEHASIELYCDKRRVKNVEFSGEALEAIRGARFSGLASQREIFDLRHSFSEPASLKINWMVYDLECVTPEGKKICKVLEIPVSHYTQRSKLTFPLKGNFLAFCHSKMEWSQWYAIDLIPLGPKLEIVKRKGKNNRDFFAWGKEIFAPADGVVVYARNDVPDNDRPTVTRRDIFTKLPEPQWAIGGNVVVIDHGNNEFSFLAHLQQGSVRVRKGDKVEKGQVIGLLGNSGNSDAPHLHYHLMAGGELFRSDGLPIYFENVFSPLIMEEPVPTPLTGVRGMLILKAK
jgi:hypothetical protein